MSPLPALKKPTADQEWSQFQLGSLPLDCLAVVFSLCPPKTVCRLACVNRSWKQAAGSDVAWSRVLSWMSSGTPGFPEAAAAPMRFFNRALKGIHSPDNATRLAVDLESGLPTFAFSAVEHFWICWLNRTNPEPYWSEEASVPGSHFRTCAHLSHVCWFEIRGNLKIDFSIPAGRYALYWKVAKGSGWQWDSPALCKVKKDSVAGVMLIENLVDFRTRGTTARAMGEEDRERNRNRGRGQLNWRYFKVGEVVLEQGVDLCVALHGQDSPWKEDMYFDSLVMQML